MRFPRPERPFWNRLQKASSYTFLEAGCWLAASCCTAAVALTAAASAGVCCCLPAAPCCCLLLVLLLVAAAAVVLLQSQTASKARTMEKDDFSYFFLLLLLATGYMHFYPKGSNVLFPGALPLASAGVGGLLLLVSKYHYYRPSWFISLLLLSVILGYSKYLSLLSKNTVILSITVYLLRLGGLSTTIIDLEDEWWSPIIVILYHYH